MCLGAFHEYKSDQEVVLYFYAEVLPLHQLKYNSVVRNLTPKMLSKFWAGQKLQPTIEH
jgi:hypothetical protein